MNQFRSTPITSKGFSRRLFQGSAPNISSGSPPVFRSVSTNTVSFGNTSLTINKPAGTVQNDYLIAIIVYGANAAVPNGILPSGWTNISGHLTFAYGVPDGQDFMVFGLRAGASEPSSYNFTDDSAQGAITGMILCYSNVDTVTALDVSVSTLLDPTTYSSPISISVPGITTITKNDLLVWAGSLDNFNVNNDAVFTAPSGFTLRADITSNTFWNNVAAADKPQTSAGSTGTITGTATSTDVCAPVGILIALRSATP